MTRFIIALFALAAVAVGCSNDKKPAATAQSDLTSVPPPPPSASVPTSPAPMPVTAVEPAVREPQPASAGPIPGQTYVVKRGDTLWSLAQKAYGDGKQYKRIAAANPSIKGDRLLAGQTITIP